MLPTNHIFLKRMLFWTAALAALVLTVLYGYVQLVYLNGGVKKEAEKELSKALKGPVTIGSIYADWKAEVVFNRVSFTLPGNPWEARVFVPKVVLSLQYTDLLYLKRPLAECLRRLSFESPAVELFKKPASSPGWIPTPGMSPPSEPLALPIPTLPVDRFQIADGTLTATRNGQVATVLRGLQLSLTRSTAGYRVLGGFLPPGSISGSWAKVDGRIVPETQEVQGRFLVRNWPLRLLSALLQETAALEPLGGTLDGDIPFHFKQNVPFTYQAQLTVRDGSVRPVGATGPVLSHLEAKAGVRPGEIRLLRDASVRTGGTEWIVTGVMPLDGSPVSLTASAEKLKLEDLVHEILRTPKLEAEGEGRAVLRVGGTLKQPVIVGVAGMGPGRIGLWRIEALDLEAAYKDGAIRLNRAEGKLYDGTLSALGEMSPGRGPDSPIRARLTLRKIRTQPLAELLGLKDWEGRTDLDVSVDGTAVQPVFNVKNSLKISRTVRGKTNDYLFNNEAKYDGRRLWVSTVVNGDTKFESEWTDQGDVWELQKIVFRSPKQSNRLKGSGRWPKNPRDPVDVNLEGRNIQLDQVPFFKEQFPGVAGAVQLNGKVEGTRHNPSVLVELESSAMKLGNRPPEPMALKMTWNPRVIRFEKLNWGDILKASGSVGLEPAGALDARLEAHQVPIDLLSGFFKAATTENPSVQGDLTGSLRFLGTRDNPLMDGHARLAGFRSGPWAFDAEADLAVENDKLFVNTFQLRQPAGDQEREGILDVTGSLQTGANPSKCELQFKADAFRLGGGPRLTGRFHCNAETAAGWLKEWKGRLSFPRIQLEGEHAGAGKFAFSNLSTTAEWKDRILGAELHLGDLLQGRVILDSTGERTQFEGKIDLMAAELEGHKLLAQFVPADLKLTGRLVGSLERMKAPLGEGGFRGRFSLQKGRFRDYACDQLDLSFSGDMNRIHPQVVLTQGYAKYVLAGTLESSKGFWSPDSQVRIEGPLAGESFSNLLLLLGVSGNGKTTAGTVSGNLSITGTLGRPVIGFSGRGKDVRFGKLVIPEAEWNLTAEDGALMVENGRLSLGGGEAVLERARLAPRGDGKDGWRMTLLGTAREFPLSGIRLNGRLEADGLLIPGAAKGRPVFEGKVRLREDKPGAEEDVAVQLTVLDGVATFRPSEGAGRLSGALDLSKPGRMVFRAIKFEHPDGSLEVDGVLEQNGPCKLTSDATQVDVGKIGRLLSSRFPLTGKGNYHLILEGTLDRPIFNASFNLSGGRFFQMPFDLFDGTLTARDDLLRVGTAEVPVQLSRNGVYVFSLRGTVPLALTAAARNRVRNKEMDLTASMPQGDLGLLLMAGFVKEARGPLDFSAHVTGTYDHPMVNADLEFKGGHLAPKMIASSIDDLQGRIKIRNNLMVVEDFNARIGQGRVFIWTPPAEESKMALEGFLPRFYDLRIRTVTERGVMLNIPAIMRGGEWGEIHFGGTRREDPLLLVGPAEEPHVVGTAFLDTGHYTFPPVAAKDEKGNPITYKELADVYFELNLVAGRDCWYSNDFNTNYLELKVNPGDKIFIGGKDSNKKPNRAGIQSRGSAASHSGYLRYLNREFKVSQASMHIPNGEMPLLTGRGTDRLKDVDIITSGGVHRTDVDIWVDFDGPIGGVNFKLDSNPRFASGDDPEVNQQLLLSYILFGRDMTGFTREDLKKTYEQQVGKEAGQAVLESLDRVASAVLSRRVRRLTRSLGGVEIDLKTKMFQEAGRGGSTAVTTAPGSGEPNPGAEAPGNTGTSRQVASVELKKYLDERLAVVGNLGLGKEEISDRSTLQKQFGLDYELTRELSLNTRVGENEEGVAEKRVGFSFRAVLPDVKKARSDDKTPPKLERFEVYPMGPGTLQVLWTTDEVAMSEIRLLDEDGNEVKTIKADKGFEYYHEIVLENMEPDTHYGVQLTVRDLNGNSTVSLIKDVFTPPS